MAPNLEKKDGSLPDVVILCGGLGRRISSVVADVPKPLAAIGGISFLDILLKQIFDQGFQKVILAVGHMGEKIVEKYPNDSRISFSVEDAPLGTGGAVINALGKIESEHFIVMNGDSYCDIDLFEFYKKHKEAGSLLSIVVAKIDDASDRGSICIGDDSRIISFEEKTSEKSEGLINAGIYAMKKEIAEIAPGKKNFSLEYDLFPAAIESFCYGHIVSAEVLDIGTPERYELAKKILGKEK